MIEVRNLQKRYGEIEAVRDISFQVEKGEIVGLLGSNGAGKSTTMRIITGFLPATDGQVTVAGHDVRRQSLQARRHIGYMPESCPLYTNMTARRYVEYMAAMRGVPARDRKRMVAQAMESAGITHVADRLIRHLSKGYRQRTGLAQAIVADPEILILDEPTIGLDPTQIIEIRHLIQEMAKRRTVILSSHILPEVSEVCQRVVIVNRGRVIADEATQNLGKRLQAGQRLLVKVGGDPQSALASLRRLESVANVTAGGPEGKMLTVEGKPEADLRAVVAKTLVEGGHDLLHLAEQSLTLEEIFVRLVRNTAEEEAA